MTRVAILVQIDATDLFENENANWQWCVDNATFAHHDACEFIVHIGHEPDADDSPFRRTVARMADFGCTDEFLLACREAAGLGASWVLFYAA